MFFLWTHYAEPSELLAPRRVSLQVFLPAARQHLWVAYEHANDGSVMQIASLEQLYKVFERC
jgi:hypothetical protein